MKATVQKVALIFGIGFLAAAVAGLMAGGTGMQPTDPEMAPKALGLFPVNILHNMVHLVFGIWGLMAARSVNGSVSYLRIAGVIYAVLIPLGFIAPDGFGLIPLGGNDPYLHIALALPMLFFGFRSDRDRASVAP